MKSLLKHIFQFSLFILVQVYVLDRIHLHYLITPYIYYLFILWLPFRINRSLLMLVAFLLGLTLDVFRMNPGFHAAACVLMAYFRPAIISLLIPQEGADSNYDEPSVKSMGGFLSYFIYLASLSLIHNAWVFLLEAWQFANGWYFISKTLFSTIVSLLLIMVAEMLFNRKQKFRTNTI